MTKLEEIMLECCELSLEEVQELHKFLDILESKKQETAAFCASKRMRLSHEAPPGSPVGYQERA